MPEQGDYTIARPRGRSEFEIAVICAEPVEWNAVEAVLDGNWEKGEIWKYDKAPNDENSYVLGWIERHNIVLAFASQGKRTAANVATSLRFSFPYIKLVLVVGICGGARSSTNELNETRHILLGDVIVSTGVKQYDFGSQYPDTFVIKETLDANLPPPPAGIQDFLRQISSYSGSETLEEKTAYHLETIFEKPRFKGWRYPGDNEDILFKPDYRHKHYHERCAICDKCKTQEDEVCNDALVASCANLGCDSAQQVLRDRLKELRTSFAPRSTLSPNEDAKPPKPLIHFGPVASGDKVMKSGIYRNKIVRKENVIAFEMESAGVWGTLPTVVIKSVYDYADSHKNDRWQKYAAASAATYMKAFVGQWRTTDQTGVTKGILKRHRLSRMARAGDALPVYEHEPLSHDNSLRLLKLWHGDEQTEEVVCDIFEVTPDEKGHYKYEAVSWTWDSEGPMNLIKINKNVGGEDTAFAFSISHNLYLALKALRYKEKIRVLWVDAICINQKYHQPDERNHQIPMMPSIYGGAEQVCVWLGAASKDSDQAIDFIETIMKDIWKLDQLCEDRHVTGDWAALLKLIMRPWFSRRWIVQEIALARNGVIYCGPRNISWRTFSDAVSLFVEVETATHRLSDIMKKESISNHIPDFFNDVADLSATLLIDTTNSLFRRLPNGEKDSIMSLEYLVARLSMFNTTHPSDAVYSLLAIAKDTNPTADQVREQNTLAIPQLSALARGIRSKPFYVNYDQPYIDTCKDFVEFSIRQSEASRALDIMCRPWAPRLQKLQPTDSHQWELPSWIRSVKDAAFEVNTLLTGQKIGRVSADALVGLPTFGQRNYSAAGTKKLDLGKFRFAKRSRHYSMFVEGFAYDEIGSIQEISRDGNLPITWLTAGAWVNHDQDPPDELWRTIVANRGPDGRNALTFYPTAFKESLKKGKSGDILKTAYLINYGQCSIVAQFLRRVQAVIWNRKLMHTKGHKHGQHDTCRNPERPVRLGLVHQDTKPGHLICFLYGCTVPVVLRRVEIPAGQIETERIEDEESREQEAKIMIRRLLHALRTREQSRKKRKADLEELQKKRGLSSVDKTPDSYYCKSKRQAATTVPPWIEHGLRDYQVLATFCLSLVSGVCIQATETEILRHLLFSLSLAFALIFAYSQGKVLRRELYNAVRRLAERVEPWSKRVKSWRAKIRPRPTPPETVKVNASKYYYEFVGECYLHGMMDGEAIKYQNDNKIKAEIFEIR